MDAVWQAQAESVQRMRRKRDGNGDDKTGNKESRRTNSKSQWRKESSEHT